MKRYHAYAKVSEAEYAIIRARARRDGLSISDYIRRCVNSCLLEEGDDVPLLEERGELRGRPSARDLP